MPKVIIHDAIDKAGFDILATRPEIETVAVARDDDAALAREIRHADAIILRYLPLDAAVIGAAERLKVIARHGVGYDNVDMAAANAARVPVAIVGDANAVTVAELALYLMLAVSKRGVFYDGAVRGGNYIAREAADHRELYQKSVLIIGFGRVGSRVAQRCRAFDMRVFACDPYIPQARIRDAGCTPVADFHDALPEMDIVTVHVPLNDETRGMIGGDALARTKRGAILINSARGPIVDSAAVAAALGSGQLLGAGIDVFDEEPPAADDPLINHPATVLTPHMGGSSQECFVRMAERCAHHVLDALDGRLDPAFVVNPEVVARS